MERAWQLLTPAGLRNESSPVVTKRVTNIICENLCAGIRNLFWCPVQHAYKTHLDSVADAVAHTDTQEQAPERAVI